MDAHQLKQLACITIDAAAGDLNELSQQIWSHPETADQEYFAHDVLTRFLKDHGFERVDKKYQLETAFRATYGDSDSEKPHVGLLCEYDALPDIGHACGHNLIAEVGIAAGLALKAVLSQNPSLGKMTILGTPAEEENGGKVRLLKAGAFEGIDFAMMAHPSKYELLKPNYVARKEINFKYTGRESHAAEWPWEGINALDAAVLCYQSISCLRQQMVPGWMVHGVISNGGQRPNIIPGNSQVDYYIRCPTSTELKVFEEKVLKCAEGAASATSCKLEVIQGEEYTSLMTNETMIDLYEKNGTSLGIEFERREKITKKLGGSSDMSDVSHAVPSIHPEFRIGTDFNSHTQEFAPASGSAEAQTNTLKVAKSLAMTAIDIMLDHSLMSKIRKDFEDAREREKNADKI
ncbi:peptidase M20 domain-containing protein 2-like [Mizuhopecten yessoensis]|uniref:Peptidase M20 domain-containing protein 2 n=1 Tax=Mizuhopecten yessoensis TaxID=6573 RepID=A0A210Q5B8_MIZYE|nr:peptidase M20 domain-containing protein 2-like [Mizuhopecten yessoensis]OWF43934.1 Peptidase M20 domain-containing protein 2 [Mizuhopecten yessoensis]